MRTFKAIVEAKLAGDTEAVTEASLSHFYRAWLNSGEESFAILTSWRAADSSAKNADNFEKLKKLLRGWGHGFIRTKGNWKGGSEPSLFVPGITKAQALRVLNLFSQDAVIYGGPDTQGQAVILLDTGEVVDVGSWHPRQGNNWTSWRGRNFTFEAEASSWSEKLIEQVLIHLQRNAKG